MDVHPGDGEQPVAGHVVLVAVAVDHGVDGHRRPAPVHHLMDGSTITVSPAPRTSRLFPPGYFPLTAPDRTLTVPVRWRCASLQSIGTAAG